MPSSALLTANKTLIFGGIQNNGASGAAQYESGVLVDSASGNQSWQQAGTITLFRIGSPSVFPASYATLSYAVVTTGLTLTEYQALNTEIGRFLNDIGVS